jgi:pteridine reductase
MGIGSSALAGQVALVTGAAVRLGRHVAEALAEEGVHVVVHYRSSYRQAGELVERLMARGVEAWAVQADLADPTQAAALFAGARRTCSRPIGILVNSASIFVPSKVLSFSAAELAHNVQVNAFAPLQLCRSMAAEGQPGQIVNFLDTRVVDHDRDHAAYHLSKRMLHTMTRMLALELAPSIRVNAVAPGLILPPPGKSESYLEGLADSVPLKRHGSARDVVRAVLFLLHSDFVTGQVIYLDGGSNLKGNMYGG